MYFWGIVLCLWPMMRYEGDCVPARGTNGTMLEASPELANGTLLQETLPTEEIRFTKPIPKSTISPTRSKSPRKQKQKRRRQQGAKKGTSGHKPTTPTPYVRINMSGTDGLPNVTDNDNSVFILEANVEIPEPWNQRQYMVKKLNPDLEVTIDVEHEENKPAEQMTSVKRQKLGWKSEKDKTNGMRNDSKDESYLDADSVFDAMSSDQSRSLLPMLTKFREESEILSDNRDPHTSWDICGAWVDCDWEQRLAGAWGESLLPSCPCIYSFSVHYDEQIYDQHHAKWFRWRDASGPRDHLAVYRPGARWCIRSIATKNGGSVAAQQCCYDGNRQLITRGAAAGTPSMVSPDISRDYHRQFDILPWIFCKGDWTRYHVRRPPNNQNSCKQNPENEEFMKQVKLSKEY